MVRDDYDEAVREDKDRDISRRANAPRLTWWSRWLSVASPLLVAAGIGLCGYVGDRILTHIDRIGDNQIEQTRAQTKALSDYKLEMAGQLGAIVGSVNTMHGDMGTINSHFTDTVQILNSRVDVSNSRIDALSNWTKKNADDIDRLREQKYGGAK